MIEIRWHRPVYFISVAAAIVSVHPRTLRIYETERLLEPSRRNSLRLYSDADLARVRLIRYLTQERGVNLAGVRILLALLDQGKIHLDELVSDRGAAANIGLELPEPELAGD